MADRSFDKVARDLSSDFSALRDDLRKLTNVVSDLASDHADNTRSSFLGAVDKARDRFSDTADRVAGHANYASDRVRGAGAELESRIEKNPLTAVMIAIVGGLLIGAMSRSRR
jgi:ElaB/YqjD/DUF883 family membrane-anchored ribosome-binding protein